MNKLMDRQETKAVELKGKRTRAYLQDILCYHKVHVDNSTKLDIPGFGRVAATSEVDHEFKDGEICPYFTFMRGKKSGEFFMKQHSYYVLYNQTGGRN